MGRGSGQLWVPPLRAVHVGGPRYGPRHGDIHRRHPSLPRLCPAARLAPAPSRNNDRTARGSTGANSSVPMAMSGLGQACRPSSDRWRRSSRLIEQHARAFQGLRRRKRTMYPPPDGPELTADECRTLDDEYLTSDPTSYFRSRIYSLLEWTERSTPGDREPSADRRRFQEILRPADRSGTGRRNGSPAVLHRALVATADDRFYRPVLDGSILALLCTATPITPICAEQRAGGRAIFPARQHAHLSAACRRSGSSGPGRPPGWSWSGRCGAWRRSGRPRRAARTRCCSSRLGATR